MAEDTDDHATVHGDGAVAQARVAQAQTQSNAFRLYAGGTLGLALFVWNVFNQFIETEHKWIHNPEDFAPLLAFWHRWFVDPLTILIKYLVSAFGAISRIHLRPLGHADDVYTLVASVLPTLIGIVVLYASVLGLSKLYDATNTTKALRSVAIFIATLLSLPLAGLALIRIAHDQFHVQLEPYAENALTDYRLLVHSAIGWFYGLFLWSPPPWLKDLATISIISVGMNRKAAIPQDYDTFGLDWPNFKEWQQDAWHRPVDIFDAFTLPQQIFAMWMAFLVGWLFRFLLFPIAALFQLIAGARPSLPIYLPDRIAALTFVIVRGLLGSGLVYAAGYAWFWLRRLWFFIRGKETGDISAVEQRTANLYLLYSILTGVFVIAFVYTLRISGT